MLIVSFWVGVRGLRAGLSATELVRAILCKLDTLLAKAVEVLANLTSGIDQLTRLQQTPATRTPIILRNVMRTYGAVRAGVRMRYAGRPKPWSEGVRD